MLQVGQRLELGVDDLAFGGDGVAHHQGRVIFVAGALPGEEVLAEIGSVKKRHARARVLRVLTASPERRQPPCPLFGRCGGCDWQHLAPEAQLRHKARLACDVLRRVGQVDLPLVPTHPSPQQ